MHKKHLAVLKKNSDLQAKKASKLAREERAKARRKLEKQMLLERKNKEIQRLKEYQKSLANSKIKLIYRALYYSFSKKYKQAIAVFASALKEPQRVSKLKKADAVKFAAWAEKVRKAFSVAELTWNTLYNAGDKLNGLQIEIKRGQLGKVKKIKNGRITVRTFSGKNITVPLTELSPNQFKKLVDKTGTLLGNPKAMFFYMLCAGEFKLAKEICPNDWLNDFEDIVIAYLKERIKLIFSMDDEKEQKKAKIKLKKYYRMPEFKKARKLLKQEEEEDSSL